MLLELFLKFMKIGLFSFGGGYGMISLLEDEVVENEGWLTHEELSNVTVIAESTPGSIALKCATYVGYKQAKMWGAIVSTIGVVIPSFVIIYLISLFFDQFMQWKLIQNAFRGIQVAVAVLIVDAGWNLFKKMEKNVVTLGIGIIVMIVMLLISIFSWNFSSIFLLLIAAAIGLVLLPIYRKHWEEKK